MSEDDEEAAPSVELGEGDPVDGAPLARVASRLTFPLAASGVRAREGDTTVRTPDGPRTVADLLEEGDATYFPDRTEFLEALSAVAGEGPIPTGE